MKYNTVILSQSVGMALIIQKIIYTEKFDILKKRELKMTQEQFVHAKTELDIYLQERIKELSCLYGISQLIETHGNDLDKILQGVVNLLPQSWQYPEISVSRVEFDGREFISDKFAPSNWKQMADIIVEQENRGRVEVHYTKKMPTIDEGPFLKEERQLINAVASHIGRASKYIRIAHSLQERVKELSCLYGVSKIIETHGNSIENILQGIVTIIPQSWQYPRITCCRVTFEGSNYSSGNFRCSPWKQTAEVKCHQEEIGQVVVYYLEEMPIADEGPFLHEERLLINAVAERISRAIERIQAQQELEVERTALENMNIALREVISKVQDEKDEIGNMVRTNVDKVIIPIVNLLENRLPLHQQGCIGLLKKNLEEIISPFTITLSKKFNSLTPVEIQICNMIKIGLSTKEIAKIRNVSPSTVCRHREHIRAKLKLVNKSINLTTFLKNHMAS